MDKLTIALIISNVVLFIILLVTIVASNKREKFSPFQRFTKAGRYASNNLMPSFREADMVSRNNVRDNTYDFLAPTPPVAQQVSPVVAPTVTAQLNVSDKDLIKAGSNTLNSTEFVDNSIPDTSALPAVVQTGVLPENSNKENYCGSNTRLCPTFLDDGSFMTTNLMQRSSISGVNVV